MPLDRFLHAVAGHSAKLCRLNDFEYRVWTQYLLSADDFGVMRMTAAQIQADNDALAMASPAKIMKALRVISGVDLLNPFEHQGKWFLYQPDWQRFQKVEYPRTTTMPKLPPSDLAKCDEATQYLFLVHPGGKRAPRVPKKEQRPTETLAEDLESSSEEVDALARAGARPTAKANGSWQEANGTRLAPRPSPTRAARSMGALGSSPAQHIGHARCNDRGLCIPQALYVELLGRFANDVGRFDAFYESILAQMPDDFVPAGSVFRFWHDMLAKAFPDLTPKPSAREAAMKAEW